jgi:hypothetical protein
MELDKALEFAVILAWEDLVKLSDPSSVRVEYRCEPGTPLDRVTVWSTGAGGYQKRVCDSWTSASLTHPGGPHFRNGYCSDKLAKTLDFIMTNQGQFTRPADACREGSVLIHPPAAHDRSEAGIRLGAIRGFPDFKASEAHWAPPSAFARIEAREGTSSS